MSKLKVAILISGRGSNMGSIARAAMDPEFPVEIVLVLSNKPNVDGLSLAQEHGIPIQVVDHKQYANRAAHEEAVSEAITNCGAELVCLAGYMRILEEKFVNNWRGRLINIHPSLLPAFRGVDTHARAISRGVRVHGCSVHFVTSELDAGPIIAQSALQVGVGESADALSERVLELEHVLYPHAVSLIASGDVRWSGGKVVFSDKVKESDLAFLNSVEN